MQKHVNLVDLVKSFPTNIFLQNLASIQKRTSPIKLAHLAEKSENGSISNLSTTTHTSREIYPRTQLLTHRPRAQPCVRSQPRLAQNGCKTALVANECGPVHRCRSPEAFHRLERAQCGSQSVPEGSPGPAGKGALRTLVERFDIEPLSDFSAK